ncbi:Aspartate--tRNA(Asp/Asn) ligase [Dissostichus eleginoides]|uniref:Aspartate--tRNA(Asp/Asn) ligase n=1 Tax=Dissostichus eleginoides TaxID=100907 RepID=A0AAD9BKS8_DISEL|nr:Aspartate--tRNA(Asp/Asn) ligase [Dissostichus eleginoides]
MHSEVLTVVLPVVQSSTRVVLADERDQRFPRLPWTATATGSKGRRKEWGVDKPRQQEIVKLKNYDDLFWKSGSCSVVLSEIGQRYDIVAVCGDIDTV